MGYTSDIDLPMFKETYKKGYPGNKGKRMGIVKVPFVWNIRMAKCGANWNAQNSYHALLYIIY